MSVFDQMADEPAKGSETPGHDYLASLFLDDGEDYQEPDAPITKIDRVSSVGRMVTQAATGRPFEQTGNAIVDAAQMGLGTPYKWGGNDIKRGVDCSGFVKLAYAAAGIALPRTAAEQARVAMPIEANQARPGDMVIWETAGSTDRVPGADHIGIYMGGGKVMDASYANGRVVIRNLWGHYRFGRPVVH